MTAAKPEQDLEGLRKVEALLKQRHPPDYPQADLALLAIDIMRLVQAEVAAAEKRKVKELWYWVNQNEPHWLDVRSKLAAELHPPQQPPTEGGSE